MIEIEELQFQIDKNEIASFIGYKVDNPTYIPPLKSKGIKEEGVPFFEHVEIVYKSGYIKTIAYPYEKFKEKFNE